MPKVILQISYDIIPERREDYIVLAKEMKSYFTGTEQKNYSIYEQKGKKNSFVEEFVCGSMEEFESLEDNMTEGGEKLVERLNGFLKGGKAKYATLIEVASE